MSPAIQAAELCRARGGNFREELEAHLLYGYVVSRADLFLMARPVPRSADAGDLWATFPLDECDAWFVWLGVGPASALLMLMPYELPWVGWVRQGRRWLDGHWWPAAKLRQRFESALAFDGAGC